MLISDYLPEPMVCAHNRSPQEVEAGTQCHLGTYQVRGNPRIHETGSIFFFFYLKAITLNCLGILLIIQCL